MRAKTIEYKHIMDDNAGGYYDQYAYITHRIANTVVRRQIALYKSVLSRRSSFLRIQDYYNNFLESTAVYLHRNLIPTLHYHPLICNNI